MGRSTFFFIRKRQAEEAESVSREREGDDCCMLVVADKTFPFFPSCTCVCMLSRFSGGQLEAEEGEV